MTAPTLPQLKAPRRTLGVTGTNGKTSTVSMVDAIAAADPAFATPRALVTTLGATVGGAPVAEGVEAEAFDLALAGAAEGTLILEITSESLADGFSWRHRPSVAALTQITRDHLDVHASLEQYMAAKAQLFMALPPDGVAVLNACCPAAPLIQAVIPPGVTVLTYGVADRRRHLEGPLTLEATVTERPSGLALRLEAGALAAALDHSLTLNISGRFQGENALAAALVAHGAGMSPAAIAAGLSTFSGVPGRFQRLGGPPEVIVDYGHNPDGLLRALQAARRLLAPGGRLRCVFGCGGDRDPGKRPLMGQAAHRAADVVYLTSDNPRHERPEAIADDVLAPIADRRRWRVILDRRAAIAQAIADADPADVVLIAGRGHERRQQIGDAWVELDDFEEARAALSLRPPSWEASQRETSQGGEDEDR